MWCTEFGVCFQAPCVNEWNDVWWLSTLGDISGTWLYHKSLRCVYRLWNSNIWAESWKLCLYENELACAYRTGFMIFITCTKKESSLAGLHLKLWSCCAMWKEIRYFSQHLVCFSFKPNTVLTHEAHYEVRFLNYAGFKWKQFNFLLKWHPDFVPSCLWMNVSSDSVTTMTSLIFIRSFPHHISDIDASMQMH